jgi:hypothetical protein
MGSNKVKKADPLRT